ncbi:helix-turn-helix domain-containing protein [Spirosoma montaniterrae]|nr:AraC family transcriptional regulator [Spirosoma montaniterrae]
MKPSLQSLRPDTTDSSFASYWIKVSHFGFHWHYHPEVELCYIHRGSGTRMVGDSVHEFSDGDLVLLGANLPHTWISQQYANEATDNMQVYVIQFLPELLTKTLLGLPEFAAVDTLLRRASRGLAFSDGGRYYTRFEQLTGQQGLARFLTLLSILDELATTSEAETLASPKHSPLLSRQNEKRMQDVFGYIHNHFANELSLGQIADIACMNEASFCRYFRKATGQTLTSYINDLRIGQACQLLIETQQPITAIAQQVGFNSFANFNKSFTQRKGLLPRAFRRKMSR